MTKRKKKAVLESPRHRIVLRNVEDLLLDPMNYRLPEECRGMKQLELLEVLADDYSLMEIGQSMADNGYFSEEPLVTLQAKEKGKLTVVEGNRRLAALKLLTEEGLARKLKLKGWILLADELKYSIDTVPVIIYKDRVEITPYLGFRHITGVKKWEPFAKARFIDYLISEQSKTFSEAAREIGSRTPTIRQNYLAYRLVVQARESFNIDTSRAEDDFGVLYRGFNSPGIRDFIGLSIEGGEKDLFEPVPKDRVEELSELLLWMFGNEGKPAALRDSRQITNLGIVLQSKEATETLRVSWDLDYAFRISGGEERRLIENLKEASYYLDQALPDAHRHSESEEAVIMVKRCWQTMKEIARHFLDLERDLKK